MPGVGVVGDTRKEVIQSIRKAIKMHLEEISENGNKIPKPTTEVLKLSVAWKSLHWKQWFVVSIKHQTYKTYESDNLIIW